MTCSPGGPSYLHLQKAYGNLVWAACVLPLFSEIPWILARWAGRYKQKQNLFVRLYFCPICLPMNTLHSQYEKGIFGYVVIHWSFVITLIQAMNTKVFLQRFPSLCTIRPLFTGSDCRLLTSRLSLTAVIWVDKSAHFLTAMLFLFDVCLLRPWSWLLQRARSH